MNSKKKWHAYSGMMSLWIGLGLVFYFLFKALLPPPFIELPAASQHRNATAQLEVTYYFWYGCETCYEFESDVSTWKRNLPPDVHVTYAPMIAASPWDTHAHLHYTLLNLGVAEQLHNDVFRAIHTEKTN